MNTMYKKIKILSFIITTLLTFPFHFIYKIFPNFLTATLFPINESIFEHMKLFITPALIAFALEMFIMKKKRICIQNNFLALLVEILASIGLFLTIFLPFYFKLGENFIFNIALMIICIAISKYLGYLLIKEKDCLILNNLAFLLIIFLLFTTIFLSFHPLNNEFFKIPK